MLGSHFTRLLKQKKIPFVANDYNELDITQLEPVSEFVRKEKITHVINCAAYTQVDKAETEQKQAYLVNAIGPHNLALAAQQHGARLIHFSTDYVFDGKGKSPYTEEQLCAPIGAYGMSKLAGEIKILDEHKNPCIIRTSWLFGFFGKNFVETMLRLMNEKDQLRIVSDQVGRPTYCQDLAEAALVLLDEEGIFHFANANETSWHKFAVEIYQQAKKLQLPLKVKSIDPILTHEYPTAAQRPPYSTLSTGKFENFSRKSPRPWTEALYDYLLNYKKIHAL